MSSSTSCLALLPLACLLSVVSADLERLYNQLMLLTIAAPPAPYPECYHCKCIGCGTSQLLLTDSGDSRIPSLISPSLSTQDETTHFRECIQSEVSMRMKQNRGCIKSHKDVRERDEVIKVRYNKNLVIHTVTGGDAQHLGSYTGCQTNDDVS
jgi:hypothetical protein